MDLEPGKFNDFVPLWFIGLEYEFLLSHVLCVCEAAT